MTEDYDIKAAWQRDYDSSLEADSPSRCSVTGSFTPSARVHNNIQGVWGSKASGAKLVSFKEIAFCSYGHKQGE